MSKQSEAKKHQNYNPIPDRGMCSNCKHYTSNHIANGWLKAYIQEKNIRCGIGGFTIKKTATCSSHEFSG